MAFDFANDGGSVDQVTGTQVVAIVERRLAPAILAANRVHGQRRERPAACAKRVRRPGAVSGDADRLHGNRLDDQRARRHQEAEAGTVLAFKVRAHGLDRGPRQFQRAVSPLVFHRQAMFDAYALRRYALIEHFAVRGGGQPREVSGDPCHGGFIEPRLHRLRFDDADIGKPDSVRREHARQRVHEYRIHVEGIGDETSVLSAGAAEARERVAADVVAALHGDLADGVRHVVDRDPQEPQRQLGGTRGVAGGGTDVLRQLLEAGGDARGVERQVALITEDPWKELRTQAPEHDVAVGQGERSAAAVRGRARQRAGGLRSDA